MSPQNEIGSNPMQPPLKPPQTAGNAAINVAGAAAVVGVPAGITAVWILNNYFHANLNATDGAAVGSVAAGVFGYLWHVAQILIEKWVNRL